MLVCPSCRWTGPIALTAGNCGISTQLLLCYQLIVFFVLQHLVFLLPCFSFTFFFLLLPFSLLVYARVPLFGSASLFGSVPLFGFADASVSLKQVVLIALTAGNCVISMQ